MTHDIAKEIEKDCWSGQPSEDEVRVNTLFICKEIVYGDCKEKHCAHAVSHYFSDTCREPFCFNKAKDTEYVDCSR